MKLVLQEDGSDIAVGLWDEFALVTSSQIAYTEVRAALARARRLGRLGTGYGRVVREFERFAEGLAEVTIDRDITREAGKLSEIHDLRALDALHLASALLLGNSTVLVTWDVELARAARAAGLAVAPPTDNPL